MIYHYSDTEWMQNGCRVDADANADAEANNDDDDDGATLMLC